MSATIPNTSRPANSFPFKALLWMGVLGGVMLIAGLGFLRFDVVVHAAGVVEGTEMVRIHAPRQGSVLEIHARSGSDVAEGDLLFLLEGSELEKDLFEARLRQTEARRALRGARARLGELERTGLGFDTFATRQTLPLREEELLLMEEMEKIHASLREGGSGTRMEEINSALRLLAARQQQLRDRLRVELETDGLLELAREREMAVLEESEQMLAILEERIEGLLAEKARLRVTAPRAGRLTRVRFQDPGASVEKGDLLATLYQPDRGYVARMVVSDRNVDLIRPGMPVRMSSSVFEPTAEGYILGTVLELVRDEEAPASGGFEVRVSLDQSPVEPVIGSRIRGEIILQKQGLLGFLRQKPLRNPPEISAPPGAGS